MWLYQRQLANLSIQENRLRRNAEKDLAVLQDLQEARRLETLSRLHDAARAYILAVRRNQHELFDPEALGFEFTIKQIEVRAIELQPRLLDHWAAEKPGHADSLIF